MGKGSAHLPDGFLKAVNVFFMIAGKHFYALKFAGIKPNTPAIGTPIHVDSSLVRLPLEKGMFGVPKAVLAIGAARAAFAQLAAWTMHRWSCCYQTAAVYVYVFRSAMFRAGRDARWS